MGGCLLFEQVAFPVLIPVKCVNALTEDLDRLSRAQPLCAAPARVCKGAAQGRPSVSQPICVQASHQEAPFDRKHLHKVFEKAG